MSLRPVESFELVCDRCNDRYEDGDYTIFGPGNEPRENASDGDWWCAGYGREDERGPTDRDLCPGCQTTAWTDDDEVLEHIELPIPIPHTLVRNPRYTEGVARPWEWCQQDGCHLPARHEVHGG